MSKILSAVDGAQYVKRGPLALERRARPSRPPYAASNSRRIGIHFGADHRQAGPR